MAEPIADDRVEEPGTRSERQVRNTIIFSESVDRHVAMWCAKEGITRSAFLEKLATDFLERAGWKPTLSVRNIKLHYD